MCGSIRLPRTSIGNSATWARSRSSPASSASIALVLATIGVFGVFSYVVQQRTREIGIRTALGASSANVVSSDVGRQRSVDWRGIVIGFVAAVGVSRMLQSELFGATPFDPLVFGAVRAGAAVAGGLLATYVPARRAARIDPTARLRAVIRRNLAVICAK